jgi:hypothetical protein
MENTRTFSFIPLSNVSSSVLIFIKSHVCSLALYGDLPHVSLSKSTTRHGKHGQILIYVLE